MSAEFKDHFSSAAASYAAHRPSYPRELADFLAGLAPARELAWDCGCGSGQFSTLLAERFERVVATDASAEQIAQATAHPRVEYRVGREDASGLPAASLDLATVAQAAHWFDLERYYAEVRRVARPEAVLALISYGNFEMDGAVADVLNDFYYRTLRGHWPPERAHVEQGYRTLAFPFEELPAPGFAMRVEWTLEQVLGYVDTWSAVRSSERAHGRAPYAALRRDLAQAWGDPETARAVRWPLVVRCGRVGAPS